jgi:hypothetical protein
MMDTAEPEKDEWPEGQSGKGGVTKSWSWYGIQASPCPSPPR